MSLYWSTKSFGGKNYIVLQHPLKGTYTKVCGVKFHDGYGVVEKDSKAHKMLRQMPIFRKAKEFPLTILKSLKFVTRSRDIDLIYGKDIYISYQRALQEHEKVQEEQKFEETKSERNTNNSNKCKYLLLHNRYCENEKVPGSTGYCRMHIMSDTELIKEIGIEIPSYFDKPGFGKETYKFLAQVCRKIEKYSKDKSRQQLKEIMESESSEEADTENKEVTNVR
jgi:hypothetical protein